MSTVAGMPNIPPTGDNFSSNASMAACLPFTPWRPVIYAHDSRLHRTGPDLLQQTCVYLVIAYLLTRTRIFIPLMHVTIRLPHRATCYIVFSLFCILGTYPA